MVQEQRGEIASPNEKASKYRYVEAFVLCNGRGERIRTFDPLVPNQMRYQAALRPDLSIVNVEHRAFRHAF